MAKKRSRSDANDEKPATPVKAKKMKQFSTSEESPSPKLDKKKKTPSPKLSKKQKTLTPEVDKKQKAPSSKKPKKQKTPTPEVNKKQKAPSPKKPKKQKTPTEDKNEKTSPEKQKTPTPKPDKKQKKTSKKKKSKKSLKKERDNTAAKSLEAEARGKSLSPPPKPAAGKQKKRRKSSSDTPSIVSSEINPWKPLYQSQEEVDALAAAGGPPVNPFELHIPTEGRIRVPLAPPPLEADDPKAEEAHGNSVTPTPAGLQAQDPGAEKTGRVGSGLRVDKTADQKSTQGKRKLAAVGPGEARATPRRGGSKTEDVNTNQSAPAGPPMPPMLSAAELPLIIHNERGVTVTLRAGQSLAFDGCAMVSLLSGSAAVQGYRLARATPVLLCCSTSPASGGSPALSIQPCRARSSSSSLVSSPAGPHPLETEGVPGEGWNPLVGGMGSQSQEGGGSFKNRKGRGKQGSSGPTPEELATWTAGDVAAGGDQEIVLELQPCSLGGGMAAADGASALDGLHTFMLEVRGPGGNVLASMQPPGSEREVGDADVASAGAGASASRLGKRRRVSASDGGDHQQQQELAPLSTICLPPGWRQVAERIVGTSDQQDAPGNDHPPGGAVNGGHVAPIVAICGPKNTGKSTYAQYLVNELLNKYPKVAYLETDVGQPEMSPPGCLSLHVLSQPLLGPSWMHLQQPVRCYFYGDTSPKADPQRYLRHIVSLYDFFRQTLYDDVPPGAAYAGRPAHNAGVPLVINTGGWTKGLGFEVLLDMLRYMVPSHVVQLRGRPAHKNLPHGRFWDPETVAAAAAAAKAAGRDRRVWIEGAGEESGAGPTEVLYVESMAAGDDVGAAAALLASDDSRAGLGKNTVERRALQLLAYLQPAVDASTVQQHLQAYPLDIAAAFSETARQLALQRPYQVPLGALKIVHLHSQVAPGESLVALNASLVGLASSSFGGESDGIPVCLGLGVVRAVDGARGLLYLLTPLPPQQLRECDTLLHGRIEIPTRLLQAEGFTSPYLCQHSIASEGTGSAAIRGRNNLQRKGIRVA